MIHKIPTLFFTAFIVTGVMSITSDSLAFVQGDHSGSERRSPEIARQAEALLQSALRLSDDRDSEPARQQIQEAMRLWMQIHEPEEAAKAAAQMGDRCKQARKYKDALSYYRQALDLKSLAVLAKANVLNAIGRIYSDLYVRDLAVRYFTQAQEQARIVNDLSAQTIALTGLGEVYRQEGELGKSLMSIRKALRLREKDRAGADPSLLLLKGLVSQEQGLVEKAKGAFDEALAINVNTGDVAGQVKALCALSTLSLLVSREQVAREQAEQAGQLAQKEEKRVAVPGSHFGDHWNVGELQWHAWLARARAERALGLTERALASYSWAINYFEGLWWGFYVATETSAVAFREEAQAAYRENVDLLMENGQFELAYGLADQALGRTLLNFSGARRARPRSEDSAQAATLRELSRFVHSRLQRLGSGLSRQQRAKVQRDLEETEYKIEEIRLQTEMEHSKDRLVWSQLATADKLQKKMAQDQTALAEFSLGENRSFVWLITQGKVYFEILPSRKEIEDAVKPYLDLLSAAPNHLYIDRDLAKLREQSTALFATLFGGLSSQIEPDQRLIIVPDGLLRYLPFEALIHNGRYLVEDHEISYSPSASMLVQSQESSGGHAETGDRMELLAFGDPIFGPELKASVTRKLRNRHIAVIRNARASRGFRLPPLPRTRDEVQYIASLFPADRTRLYLGEESTEDAVKRESLRRYRRVHFATHSLIDEVSPSRSAVVLTLNNNPEEDGFLDVNEISELDLDCDLVVLSACQTGRGQLLSGEGIVGLSRAFLYAGARSVVVSLWSVSDISTGHLMKNFYQHLADNLGNSAALRLAKLQMLQGGTETRHPYYWAPFIAVGKP